MTKECEFCGGELALNDDIGKFVCAICSAESQVSQTLLEYDDRQGPVGRGFKNRSSAKMIKEKEIFNNTERNYFTCYQQVLLHQAEFLVREKNASPLLFDALKIVWFSYLKRSKRRNVIYERRPSTPYTATEFARDAKKREEAAAKRKARRDEILKAKGLYVEEKKERRRRKKKGKEALTGDNKDIKDPDTKDASALDKLLSNLDTLINPKVTKESASDKKSPKQEDLGSFSEESSHQLLPVKKTEKNAPKEEETILGDDLNFTWSSDEETEEKYKPNSKATTTDKQANKQTKKSDKVKKPTADIMEISDEESSDGSTGSTVNIPKRLAKNKVTARKSKEENQPASSESADHPEDKKEETKDFGTSDDMEVEFVTAPTQEGGATTTENVKQPKRRAKDLFVIEKFHLPTVQSSLTFLLLASYIIKEPLMVIDLLNWISADEMPYFEYGATFPQFDAFSPNFRVGELLPPSRIYKACIYLAKFLGLQRFLKHGLKGGIYREFLHRLSLPFSLFPLCIELNYSCRINTNNGFQTPEAMHIAHILFLLKSAYPILSPKNLDEIENVDKEATFTENELRVLHAFQNIPAFETFLEDFDRYFLCKKPKNPKSEYSDYYRYVDEEFRAITEFEVLIGPELRQVMSGIADRHNLKIATKDIDPPLVKHDDTQWKKCRTLRLFGANNYPFYNLEGDNEKFEKEILLTARLGTECGVFVDDLFFFLSSIEYRLIKKESLVPNKKYQYQ